ncbi:hypothetical protein QSV34_08235 [Porticoccus sp. W117]|uniref:hypothetical protein n=1 Tax=Porticoccus sp. W117 TaxID=3054777 RepID=UPI002599A73C|nr:hypothetical protein [Porticoccus sp. W117]MDM3871342.1 hypothetical protein [Porticoccus sp. W117]
MKILLTFKFEELIMRELTVNEAEDVDGAVFNILGGALIGGLVTGAGAALAGGSFWGAFGAGAVSGALIGSGVGLVGAAVTGASGSVVGGVTLIGLGGAVGVTGGLAASCPPGTRAQGHDGRIYCVR